ncbi:MAG TPA: FecR domain-containing protein [Planctomycetota bacterium]|nr:FecR domain-containing protein [Planctomycetota bacterium]
MSPDFLDRLQRSLSGELSEDEASQLYRELLSDPQALEECLAARAMDHDLKRLLAPDSGDDAFLRGLLNARSSQRQDPEAFVQSVTQAYSRKRPRTTRRHARPDGRNLRRLLFLAAALLLGVVSLWTVASRRNKEGPHLPKPAPETARTEDPTKAPDPPAAPERPLETVRPVEKRSEPVPSPEPKAPLPEKGGSPEPEKKATERPEPPSKHQPRPTLTAFATLQKAKGDVYVFSDSPARKSPASDGQSLAPGQGVITEGSQSGVLVTRHDSTRLTLGADTQIAFAAARPEIALFQGKLEVEAGQQVLLSTPHAQIQAQASTFSVNCGPQSTALDVKQGALRFTNVGDGRAMDLKAGQRVFAQDPPGVDRKRIDEAIRKGIAFLKSAPSVGAEVFGIANCDELILLTLLSAGVSESDPELQKYLKSVVANRLERTYSVSLQAIALEEVDRVKYQGRIAECAQFLVDNQCGNGQWTYAGAASPVTLTSETKADVATGAEEAGSDFFGHRVKPKIARKLQIKKTRDGPAVGDNSNAQYAALGLRACSEAGIAIPAATLQRAADWWRKCQYSEDGGRGVASGEGAVARGWCYNDGKNRVNDGPCCVGAYHSMTAGAVSSLIIYDHLLGTDWKKDVSVRLGMNWMTNYFMVSRNLGIDQSFKTVNGGTTPSETYHYYGLYALERVGILSAQEKLGRHPWYAEGAKFILSKQKADGSWLENSQSTTSTWDTCFAILFLRRATRPLPEVASEDRLPPKTPKEK